MRDWNLKEVPDAALLERVRRLEERAEAAEAVCRTIDIALQVMGPQFFGRLLLTRMQRWRVIRGDHPLPEDARRNGAAMTD